MNIVVYGNGYVGQVTGACLSLKGNKVTLVGVNPEKVSIINSGSPTIVEDGLPEIVSGCVRSGSLNACVTDKVLSFLEHADVVFIAVGTPYLPDGSIDLSQVESVAKSLGGFLKSLHVKPVIVMKSTVIPGSTDLFSGLLEGFSGKKRGLDFFVAMNPEFLREGFAVRDFLEPDSVVFGGDKVAVDVLSRLYAWVSDRVSVVSNSKTAESIKYFKNSLLALKIHVANVLANYCEDAGVDYANVKPVLESLDVPFFFRNGPGFGGSCFPKDVSAINSLLNSRLLRNILDFNKRQALRAIDYSIRAGFIPDGKRVSVYGLAFKPGTDDVRESPALCLIPELISRGCIVTVFDPEPKAVENAKSEIRVAVKYASSFEDAVSSADIHFVMTDWSVFKELANIQAPVFFMHRLIEPDCSRKKFCLGSPLISKPSNIVNATSYAKDFLIKSKHEFANIFSEYFKHEGINYNEVVSVACKDHRLSSSFLLD